MAAVVPATGVQTFQDTPNFRPHYSPIEMLTLGVFGGSYFQGISNWGPLNKIMDLSKVPNSSYQRILPDSNTNWAKALNPDKTFFSMPLDFKLVYPLGWFQWYCYFWSGVRTDQDKIRIKQWQSNLLADSYYINNNPALPQTGKTKFTDTAYMPTRKQKMLEWAFDPTIDPAVYLANFQF